jgi:hypothetical protein
LSGVEIQTRRTAAYCDNSAYTTIGWNVEATPIAGVLTKTPDVMNVCENEIVSATLFAGNGGNGTDELEFRTNNGTWSAWTAYTSGSAISTTGLSGVEIQTRRTASYCESTAYTAVNWIVEATPVSGTLLKSPDVNHVCRGELVSAILIAGNGGNETDFLEYRTHNGASWTAWMSYVSGTSISTSALTTVEIRTWHTATYCENSEITVATWNMDDITQAGIVTGPQGVCFGENSTTLIASGYTGNIVMWQSSTDYWVTSTNIPNTEPELFVEDLTVTTQFRTVVQSGTCNQIYSMAAEIGVDPLPVPFINGPESICGSNSLNDYTTEPGMTDYQWVVSSGQIVEGQGTNHVTVIWDEAGMQVISVDYQTVFGCTMPEPFQFSVNVVTPETPQITIDGLTLTSSATDGNQWYLNGQPIEGANEQLYEVTQNGDYTCVVLVNDCSSDVSNMITVQTVGVEYHPIAGISIFPIPNNGEFTLSVTAPAGTRLTASVINNLGKIVYQTESFTVPEKYTRSFSLGHLANGIYTVIVQNEKSQYVKKIVINHE